MKTYTILYSIKLGVFDRGNVIESNFNVDKEIDKYNLKDFSGAFLKHHKNKYDDEISVTLFKVQESEFDASGEVIEY